MYNTCSLLLFLCDLLVCVCACVLFFSISAAKADVLSTYDASQPRSETNFDPNVKVSGTRETTLFVGVGGACWINWA